MRDKPTRPPTEQLAELADDIAKLIVLLVLFPCMIVGALGAAEWIKGAF